MNYLKLSNKEIVDEWVIMKDREQKLEGKLNECK